MSSTNKKAYIYKMNLVPANVLGIIVFIILFIISSFFIKNLFYTENFFLLFFIMILYLILHEVLHGVGYLIGGCSFNKIKLGISLEKGIFYAMAFQEISKKAILISLQMPFMVIGVITYVIGLIFNIPLLVVLSIVNLVGASMDLVMFLYIMRLKGVTYSESGEPDQFVLISSEDLTKKKSMFFNIIKVKDYKKKDYVFDKIKRIEVTKFSIWFLVIFLLLGLLISIL